MGGGTMLILLRSKGEVKTARDWVQRAQVGPSVHRGPRTKKARLARPKKILGAPAGLPADTWTRSIRKEFLWRLRPGRLRDEQLEREIEHRRERASVAFIWMQHQWLTGWGISGAEMAIEDAACTAGAAATTSHAAAFISRRLKHWHFLIEINDGK